MQTTAGPRPRPLSPPPPAHTPEDENNPPLPPLHALTRVASIQGLGIFNCVFWMSDYYPSVFHIERRFDA